MLDMWSFFFFFFPPVKHEGVYHCVCSLVCRISFILFFANKQMVLKPHSGPNTVFIRPPVVIVMENLWRLELEYWSKIISEVTGQLVVLFFWKPNGVTQQQICSKCVILSLILLVLGHFTSLRCLSLVLSKLWSFAVVFLRINHTYEAKRSLSRHPSSKVLCTEIINRFFKESKMTSAWNRLLGNLKCPNCYPYLNMKWEFIW